MRFFREYIAAGWNVKHAFPFSHIMAPKPDKSWKTKSSYAVIRWSECHIYGTQSSVLCANLLKSTLQTLFDFHGPKIRQRRASSLAVVPVLHRSNC